MNSRTTPRGGYPAGAQQAYQPAPNAALLIDFDNVTMAIRSDLGKELKTLLNSEVIRGKVAVQRAYADWRRYPQYIVPLAESSVDLIFAPAYGSSKKNATDLRMAIDAMELVFTRPEIGTYILMTGDSDFSSCVLKLKEYGKYVIGVGMRESSSDLLIQNCDEYYSYHSLSGLTREGEVEDSKEDPWVLVKRAVQQMVKNGDVMRTDRLKQVMLELDPAFDEKKIGYSKFSRFVSEAASKGVLRLKKTENGQFEILDDSAPAKSREEVVEKIVADADATGNGRRRRGGRGRDDREEKRTREPEPLPEKPKAEAPQEEPKAEAESSGQAKPTAEAGAAKGDGAPVDNLEAAYALLQEAVRKSTSRDSKGVRDGDVKRKMLEISRAFDEAKLGFSKFTRFLRQAHDAEVIDLSRAGAGNYEVSLPSDGRTLPPPQVGGGGQEAAKQEVAKQESSAQEAPARKEEATPATQPSPGRLRGRRGGAAAAGGPPPILPGQVIGGPKQGATEEKAATPERAPAAEPAEQGTAEKEAGKRTSRRGRGGRAKKAEPAKTEAEAKASAEAEAAKEAKPSVSRSRRGRRTTGTKDDGGPPEILAGQVATAPAAEKSAKAAPKKESKARKPRSRKTTETKAPKATGFVAKDLGLPTTVAPIREYLSKYRGVGEKTAETLVEKFGPSVFESLHERPSEIRELVGGSRAKSLLEQWSADYAKRTGSGEPTDSGKSDAEAKPKQSPKSKPKRGSRGRGGKKAPTSS